MKAKAVMKALFSLFMMTWISSPLSLSAACQKDENTKKYQYENPIPPRLQWNANFGYCGETSFISAGLYYGQYMSQYTARAIASQNTPQYEAKSQLLLGVNDTYAAEQMRLNYVEWNSNSSSLTSDEFLTWIKSHVLLGYPVIIGVYTNEYLFYGKTNKKAGDPEYDHIVPVIGLGSSHKLKTPAQKYYGNDLIEFSDNGLWDPSGPPQYIFYYGFNCFQASRTQANSKRGNIYSLPDQVSNYGIAITGVADSNNDTLPVRLTTNVNDENPSIENGSNTPPPAMPIIISGTVSHLDKNGTYHLYWYDDVNNVPVDRFNAQASKASGVIVIEPNMISASGTYSFTKGIMSDQTIIYRAVSATAP